MIGDSVELDVGPVAHGGHCVARLDGRVVFVRHTLPGERVRVRLTEAAPEARGRTIGLSNAFGTLTRAGSVVLTGQLYEAYGMGGSLVWIVTAAGLAVGLTCISPTRRPRTR